MPVGGLPHGVKNTNKLKTRAPGRFGLDVYRLGWPMEARILGHEDADPVLCQNSALWCFRHQVLLRRV